VCMEKKLAKKLSLSIEKERERERNNLILLLQGVTRTKMAVTNIEKDIISRR